MDDANDLDNTATFSSNETSPESDAASTSITAAPSIDVTKTADDTTEVAAGQVITYTYVVTNTGNQTVSSISLSDAHGGSGAAPTPSNETLTADNGDPGDSNDSGSNGIWDTLAPGDEVTFTATYTVTQSDIDTLQ